MLDYTTFTTVMEINKNLTKSNNKTYIANIHMYSILRFTFFNKLMLDVFYLLKRSYKSLSINLKGLMGKYRNSKLWKSWFAYLNVRGTVAEVACLILIRALLKDVGENQVSCMLLHGWTEFFKDINQFYVVLCFLSGHRSVFPAALH